MPRDIYPFMMHNSRNMSFGLKRRYKGSWKTTLITAVKLQIIQKAYLVLPLLVLCLSAQKIALQLAPDIATEPPTVRLSLEVYLRHVYGEVDYIKTKL